MKKTVLLSIVMGTAAMFSSCDKQNLNPAENHNLIFKAVESEYTKSTLGSDGLSVVWSLTDKALAFYKGEDNQSKNIELSVTAVDGDAAIFQAVGPAPAEGFGVLAIHPSSAVVNSSPSDGSSLAATVKVPAAQNFTAGTYDPSAAVQLGYASDCTEAVPVLKFKNMCALGKIKIDAGSKTISDIVIAAEGANPLAAECYMAFGPDCIANIAMNYCPSNEIKMNGTFVNGETYYFAMLPGTFDSFRVTITADDGSFVAYKTKTGVGLNAKAGQICNILNVTVPESSWKMPVNLALYKDVTASTTFGAYYPSQLVDGRKDMLYISGDPVNGTPEWAIIDLGKPEKFEQIKVIWDAMANSAKAFEFQYSNDGSSFTAISETVENNCSYPGSGVWTKSFSAVTARYVKLLLKTPYFDYPYGTTGYAYRICEIEIY